MSLNEKVGQLAQLFYGFKAYDRDENGKLFLTDDFKEYVQKFGGLGMINNYFRSDPWSQRCYATGGITIEEREKAYNLLQRYMVENTRLGIPVLIEEDAPHGRQVLDSVLYLVSLNVGCSFNPKLYRHQAEAIGTESRLGGCHLPYLSNLDMAVDPRWGRSEECYTEDPYLASKMSEASIKGMNVTDEALKDAVCEADVIIFGCGGSSMRDFDSDYNDAGAINKAANYMDCGEGSDLASLELLPRQRELIKKIATLGKPIISLVI